MLCPVSFILKSLSMQDKIIAEIEKAKKTIGENALLGYLQNINNKANDFEYNLIKTLVLQYFDMSEEYMLNSTKTDATNAKQIIAYLLYRKTNYPISQVCKMLKISDRTYLRYRTNMFNIIINPQLYSTLYKSYYDILNLFNEKSDRL
jgi:hypothetical protein